MQTIPLIQMEIKIEWKVQGFFLIQARLLQLQQKQKPVDQAEKIPHIIPNPGINIGNAMVVLCIKFQMHQYLKLIL